MRTLAVVVLAALPLCACGSIKEVSKAPEMSPMGYPSALMPRDQQQLLSAREPAPQPASANSLWRSGARAFFIDQRASRVGDILTVQIDIDDKATTSNATTTQRTAAANAAAPHLLGLESTLGKLLPGGYDPSKAIETSSNMNNAGVGSVARAEKISLTIAAVVTAVLPNGNLTIQGSQEVRTNSELRQLTVAGIVRPEDISSSNTVKQTQIAEARISYGGKGDISAVQKTPVGQALIQKFSPF